MRLSGDCYRTTDTMTTIRETADGLTKMTEPVPFQPNTSIICPRCQTTIPVYSGYVTWCDACQWNVQPEAPFPDGGPFARIYRRLGQRLGDGMLRDLRAGADLRPRLSPTVLAAGAMALLVHGITVVLLVGSLAVMSTAWPNAFLILTGASGLALAWLLRPDLGQVPQVHYTRERLPRLFALLDRIAGVLGCRGVDLVVIDGSYNAFFGRLGFRQQRVLGLGLPLVVSLKPQELLSTLGHEFGHGVNGDAAQSLLVGSALRALERWHWMLQPNWDQGGLLGLAAFPVNLLAIVVRWGLQVYGAALVHLLYRQSQRAEYLADLLSMEVAGREASVTSLEKMLLVPSFRLAVERAALGTGVGLLADFEERVARMPVREAGRLRRAAILEGASLDATHPPTGHRIALCRPAPPPAP
ncbi:MAG: hypothetical protein EXR52_05465 [Dehalococcoidia bacterium]|nr:hypothetical protein [Dehalococcoidia bacterium]